MVMFSTQANFANVATVNVIGQVARAGPNEVSRSSITEVAGNV